MEIIYFVTDALHWKIEFSFAGLSVIYSSRIVLTFIWRHEYFVNYFFNVPEILISKHIVAQRNLKKIFASQIQKKVNKYIYKRFQIKCSKAFFLVKFEKIIFAR